MTREDLITSIKVAFPEGQEIKEVMLLGWSGGEQMKLICTDGMKPVAMSAMQFIQQELENSEALKEMKSIINWKK